METFYCPEGRKGKDIFQSTPPRGWRRISVVSSDLKVCISIHSTTRVETRLESNLLDISGISIHSTTRVETHDWIPLRYPPGDFNPLHHEGGDIACFPTSDILDDFNPLHHEGGDLLDLASMAPAQVISIHSTTRVETHEMCESGEIPYISIHSTTRVETPDKIGFIAEAEFQSTPPRGWRLSIGVNGLAILKFQSTPPRGWRREVPRSPLSYLLFQSTPPRGWRRIIIGISLVKIVFQSTPPRGWRLDIKAITVLCRLFQSTPPRGWRLVNGQKKESVPAISIHSTTRVETNLERQIFDGVGISIHSTTRVETLHFRQAHIEHAISIHSTTRVETAILHNNHYYSSTHFHKQIISHPLKSRPTIPAHSQIRSHCANFPVRISP